MTDTALQLRTAADLIRALAKGAASDVDGDELCCWDMERIGGHERVIEVRQHPEGTEAGVLAVPTLPGIAEHIACWDPTIAVQVAKLLDAIADPAYAVHAMVYLPALTLANLIGMGRDHRGEQ